MFDFLFDDFIDTSKTIDLLNNEKFFEKDDPQEEKLLDDNTFYEIEFHGIKIKVPYHK